MRILLTWFFILPFISFGQLNCTIELIDKYSNQEIAITPDFRIKKSHFEIDSSQNVIHVHKLRGNYLSLSSSDYEFCEKKVKRKALKNDTITLWLVPNDSICEKKHDEIWLKRERHGDTIEVSDASDIQRYVKSIMNYLLKNNSEHSCDNGLCNFANTFYFQLEFLKQDTIWQFQESTRVKQNGYECSFLEEHVQALQDVLPVFRDLRADEPENLKMRFTLTIFYR